MEFTHLHVHTEYSLLDGSNKIKEYVARVKELGMDSAAITDHGVMYGVIDFYRAAREAGINPILGCEVYVAPGSRFDREVGSGDDRYYHLVLLAENNQGYSNLMKIVSKAFVEGFYYKPRVDLELLEKYHEGIIALSACLAGEVARYLARGMYEDAKIAALRYQDIFGKGNFFLELQDHGIPEQQTVNQQLLRMHRETGIDLVATNDVHYTMAEDAEPHDVLLCLQTQKKLSDENRMRYEGGQYYVKSPEEMARLFSYALEALENTHRIAERCHVEIEFGVTKLPKYDVPDGFTSWEYLNKLCHEGLEQRYHPVTEELKKRLDYELSTIKNMGYVDYFLIVWDFIKYARDNDIMVGPGRGSAAGSLVAYTLGITQLDPIRYDLLFERFLNPERVSMPDIDVDFCFERRQEVIDYVRRKYGDDCVVQIVTFGTLAARGVIRDVGRVLDMPYAQVDTIAKMIPQELNITIDKALGMNPEFRKAYEEQDDIHRLIDLAKRLEGLPRHTSMHAAGVVIGDRPLDEHVALTRDDLSDPHAAVVAQCDMSAIYEVGLLKMDFLGLKTLTVMHDAEQYARWRVPEFKLDSVPLDDRETLDLLNRGDTMGVFQLESGGMVDTCRRYGIQKIEDIIDLLALYRPGAMQFMDEMIEVKKGLRQVEYEHPLLEQVSGETYGVMIYQEQVQAAAKLLAGYTLGGADLLRRAMGKKDPAKMAKEKAHFVEGCWKTNQIDEKTATAIFDKIEKFAGYGFNKSHSACYGHISYWTAYLKAHFPVEFLCGLMSNEANNDKIGVFIQEANRMGIEILPPDVNKSMLKFTPEKMPSGKLAVRYGLAAIKNVGEGAMQILLEEREKNGEFSSMEDICNRLDSKSVNKKILESLIRAGALDWTLEPRCVLFERVDLALSGASQVHKDKALGQGSLFDMTFEAPRVKDEPAVPEWSKEQRMGDEKDLLGAYFCGHPLDSMRGVIDAEKYTRIGLIDTLEPHELKQKHQIAGMVRSVTPKISKAGRKFAILTLEDFTGSIEVLLWSDVYEKAQEMEGGLEPGVFVSMRANIREDDRTSSKSVAAQSIDPLGGKKRKSKSGDQGPLNIIVSPLRHTRKNLEQIRDILKRYPGRSKVNLTIKDSLGHSQILELDERFRVNRCPELETELSMYN